MSSIKYAQPLRLNPKPSRILMALLVAGHLGALIILFPLDLPIVIKLVIGLLLLISLIVAWRQQPGKVGEGGVQTLTWQADGNWLLATIDGRQLTATLHESTYVHPWLVVLNFREEGRRRLLSFTLLPDALDAETFRELRVRLKVAGNKEETV